jgi:hypothetical protein
MIWPNVISKIKQNSSDMNEIIMAPCYVISKIKQNSSDMNEIIMAPCYVISKIKQNSSDMNEIILAPCDAGYVQSCTGCYYNVKRGRYPITRGIRIRKSCPGFLAVLEIDYRSNCLKF